MFDRLLTKLFRRLLIGVLLFTVRNASAVCPNPAAVIPGTTNTGFYFLSQVGGCACLSSFLSSLTGSPHAYATLVIDDVCTLNTTLTIPRRMTIAGTGIEGQGVLYFPALAGEQAALTIAPPLANEDAYVTIRDLNIAGPGVDLVSIPSGRGIELSGAHITTIERVRIAGFRSGVWGASSYSVSIDKSNISNNRQNIRLTADCNGWRIRDSLLSRAFGWSVYVAGPDDVPPSIGSNDLLLDGNRFESNMIGAVRLGSTAAMLSHNRFESNNGIGVRIEPAASSNRLITNYFSSDVVTNLGTDTICQFSIGNPGC